MFLLLKFFVYVRFVFVQYWKADRQARQGNRLLAKVYVHYNAAVVVVVIVNGFYYYFFNFVFVLVSFITTTTTTTQSSSSS